VSRTRGVDAEPGQGRPAGGAEPPSPGGPVEAGGENGHFDAAGRARMVDVAGKPATERMAVARGRVRMSAATLERVRGGTARKGDVLGVARIAGIMAAKRVGELIPLCHPLPLAAAEVGFRFAPDAVEVEAAVRTVAPTGVEMEALAAVSVACLTIYDMCKAYERGMVVDAVRLVSKAGGRSGTYERAGEEPWDSGSRY
jgi:cyclic pyranopterin phosphate synthase